jgi:hypothetical protein
MRKLNFCISLLCAALAPALLAQQVATTPVTIRVSDPTGTGVAHAQVRLVPASENFSSKPETDDNGRITFNLKPGDYALSVSAPGFSNWAQHIDIGMAGGQAISSQIIPVVLQIAEVVSPTPVYPAHSLVLAASPDRAPVTLSPAEFRALPHVTITVHNGHTNAAETYSGVPLAALLAKVNAPLGNELRGEAMTSYVIATGSDGYSVVLSIAEVDPSFQEGQVLVADTRDGKPLGKNGPFQLIVSNDKRPARWVHNLESITLQRAQ